MTLNPEQFHPNVVEYRSGGMGHREGDETRSTVGFVPTRALEPYKEHAGIQNPNIPGRDRRIIDSIREDLRSGVGIKEPIQLDYDHKNQWATIGEGNHRLAAAREEGISHVPVRVYGRAHKGGAKENLLGASLQLDTKWTGGMGEDYVPPAIHPEHFRSLFSDRRDY